MAAPESIYTLEQELHRLSPLVWASFLFLKYLGMELRTDANNELMKAVWNSLDPEAQRIIRRIRALCE